MDGLLAVDVGGVLVHAAVGVLDGLEENPEKGKSEQQNSECGPVILRGDAPADAEARDGPLHEEDSRGRR